MRRLRPATAGDVPAHLVSFRPNDWSGALIDGPEEHRFTGWAPAAVARSELHLALARKRFRWSAARDEWFEPNGRPAPGLFQRLTAEQAEWDRVHAELCGCPS